MYIFLCIYELVDERNWMCIWSTYKRRLSCLEIRGYFYWALYGRCAHVGRKGGLMGRGCVLLGVSHSPTVIDHGTSTLGVRYNTSALYNARFTISISHSTPLYTCFTVTIPCTFKRHYTRTLEQFTFLHEF